MPRRINLVVRVGGKMWLMESLAAARHDQIEVVDTVVSFSHKTREAIGQSGAVYRVYIDNSVGMISF